MLSGFADASLPNLRFLRQAPEQPKRLAAVDSEGIGLFKEPSELTGRDDELSPELRHARCAFSGLDRFAGSWEHELGIEAIEAETTAREKGADDSAVSAVYQAKKAENKPLIAIVQEEVAAAKRDFDNVCTQEILKRVHSFSRTWNWPLIVVSVIIPLIPLILLIAAAISSYRKAPAVR